MQGRKPSAWTILKGTRPGGGRSKHVQQMAPILEAPAYLNGEEREIFETIRENAPHGLLTQIDSFLLEAFARHVGLHRRAFRELDALTFDSESTKRAHPLVAIANSQAIILLKLSGVLGLTATARQRIKLPTP